MKKNVKISESQLRKIIKENLSETIKEYNMVPVDQTKLYEPGLTDGEKFRPDEMDPNGKGIETIKESVNALYETLTSTLQTIKTNRYITVNDPLNDNVARICALLERFQRNLQYEMNEFK